jgi:MurNAc alpha-1-phosphate uridylyltransferase
MIRTAMIFAAGRGERMRPLSDATPKPLLRVGAKMLIEHHLEKLAAIGVRDVVINTSHLAEQFPAALGDGSRWGVRIRYSYEGEKPLETGGGIKHALPLLGDAPFIGVSADIVSDYDYAKLPAEPHGLAHLVMVPNPAFHPRGDFFLDGSRLNEEGIGERLTFANIAVYRPAFIASESATYFKLLPLYQRAMRDAKLSGERFDGYWTNIGTPGQLSAVSPLPRAGEG